MIRVCLCQICELNCGSEKAAKLSMQRCACVWICKTRCRFKKNDYYRCIYFLKKLSFAFPKVYFWSDGADSSQLTGWEYENLQIVKVIPKTQSPNLVIRRFTFQFYPAKLCFITAAGGGGWCLSPNPMKIFHQNVKVSESSFYSP